MTLAASIGLTCKAWTSKIVICVLFKVKVNFNRYVKTKLLIDLFCSYMKDILAIIISTLYDQYDVFNLWILNVGVFNAKS